MQRLRNNLRRPWRRGFTLVELMIAMTLVGALTIMIYGLFVRTSDSLTDVEGMSVALNQARFGMEFVRTDLQSAGAQATSNADTDPWVAPNPPGGMLVHGVMGYSGWQNDSSLYGGDLSDVGDRNPQSAFSGVVVMGAYDVPSSFFVNFAISGIDEFVDPTDVEVVVESTERGMLRFLGYDPFDTRILDSVDIVDETSLSSTQAEALSDYLEDIAETRLLRVTDNRGYSQFTSIQNATVGAHNKGAGGIGGGDEMLLELENLQFAEGDEPAGFNRAEEGDVSFDAAMIDAYWYHVQPSLDDPLSFQLVRQRVDASQLANGATGLSRADLQGMTVGVPMIVAENVVDFRVWFECAPTAGVSLSGGSWEDGWDVEDSGDCIDDNPATSQPELARMAHIRLSTRTESENANRPHLEVVDGDSGDWLGFENENGQMRSYEVYPHAEGSAGVVTVQSSVELANFALRDIR